ncbi:hypothetical protein WJ972_10005 [Achromobacter insuavis]
MNDESQSIYARMAAWENIKVFDKEMAINFAEKNVDIVKPDIKSNLILYLAKESASYDAALQYVRDQISQKPDFWQSGILRVISPR